MGSEGNGRPAQPYAAVIVLGVTTRSPLISGYCRFGSYEGDNTERRIALCPVSNTVSRLMIPAEYLTTSCEFRASHFLGWGSRRRCLLCDALVSRPACCGPQHCEQACTRNSASLMHFRLAFHYKSWTSGWAGCDTRALLFPRGKR